MASKEPFLAIAAVLTLVLASSVPAVAQQKKAGAQNKQAACATKVQGEFPNRGDGMARQAAFKRCMSGGR